MEEAADAGCAQVARRIVAAGRALGEGRVLETVRQGVGDGRPDVGKARGDMPHFESARHVDRLDAVGLRPV